MVAAEPDEKEMKLFADFLSHRHANPLDSASKVLKTEQWRKLYGYVANQLFGGAEKGFGKTFLEVDYDTPDFNFLHKIRSNLYFFSAAKNFHLLLELNRLLLDEDGNLREYRVVKKDALKLNSTYNQDWLQTEYNTAVASAQMGARWLEYEANAETHLLKYTTAGDERVRNTHKVLDGIILPVTDPFWNSYYPPWDWGCRCDVTQVLKSRAKPSDISKKDLPPTRNFLGNAGKSGQVFTDQHPYFQGLSKADGKLIKKAAKTEIATLEPHPAPPKKKSDG